MKVVYFDGLWNLRDTLLEPKSLFIFGDNDSELGVIGQSVIRYAGNSMGIPTKKYPSSQSYSYYSDDELESNKDKIQKAVEKILTTLRSGEYTALVLPNQTQSFGTGLAELKSRAPLTWDYLQRMVQYLVTEASQIETESLN